MLLDRLAPVDPVVLPLASALGRVTAAPIVSPGAHPGARIALRDGWAVAASETVGATPYAPVYRAAPLPPVLAGAAMPAGCDAVLPPRALNGLEILQAVPPGFDTRDAGGDLDAGAVIVEGGAVLRAADIAVLGLAGVPSVRVRVPRVIVAGEPPLRAMLRTLALAAGACLEPGAPDIVIALTDPGRSETRDPADVIAHDGHLIAAALALRPGDGIAVGTKPGLGGRAVAVVAIPNRLDDVLAAWLLLIAPCLTALTAGRAAPAILLPLSRKIVSAPGLADLVLLRRNHGLDAPRWEPVTVGDVPWSAVSRADAFGLIAPESEGLAAGALLAGFAL